MKIFLMLFLSLSVSLAFAQWVDTKNNFEDSLHIPVCTAALDQQNPVIINSYPDGGYFIIWEDNRNNAARGTDIYAQKYDNNGNQLWAADGVPVANSIYREHFTFSSNQDYRNRKVAATDSAGGFYMCFASDSVSNYVWERVTAQHIRANGSPVFTAAGYIIARSASANLQTIPQLIADGNKGFFITYRLISSNDYIYAYNYKDENGTLKFYGGGRVNENAIETASTAPCGIKTDVIYPGTTVTDYNIWSDKQGGCNIIISMNGNNGTQGNMLCYNRLWRAKKDATVKTFFRNTSGAACPRTTTYQKGNVYLLYRIATDFQSVACSDLFGTTIYTYTNYRLLSNGYQLIDIGGYDYNYPKGITIASGGNINADLIAVTRRSYSNNTVSAFSVQGYLSRTEIFDSIPFQRCSFSDPELGFNNSFPLGVNKLNFFRDTLLGFSSGYTDFSLAGGGTNIYAAALMGNYGTRLVKLQALSLQRKTADSFALQYNSNISATIRKAGETIGSELSGSGGVSITYDFPLVTLSDKGQALFYIREYYRSARVSPIQSGSALLWGAMGRPIGAGIFNSSSYTPDNPIAVLDSTGKKGLITWQDSRNLPSGYTGQNIFMRNLERTDEFNYSPPVKKIKPVTYFSTESIANPAVLLGSSRSYSPIEIYNSYNNTGTSPVVSIKDNNNIGSVQVHVFQNVGVIRKYNGDAYLNRNYTIKTDSLPASPDFDLLLYFTKEEFAALKAADFSITSPDLLSVIRQPNSTATAPAVYSPIVGEERLAVNQWDSLDGGYYLQIKTKALGNFFVQKIATAKLCTAGNTAFTSNITGAVYQWQVNTGSGFGNVSNGGSYSGANTNTLQVINTPSSFSGNRYRCVIDNVNVSNPFYLQIANTWTGAVNTLWENTANWSCGSIPDAGTDVIINTGTVTVNSAAVCRSLKVSPGAAVVVSPGFKLFVAN